MIIFYFIHLPVNTSLFRMFHYLLKDHSVSLERYLDIYVLIHNYDQMFNRLLKFDCTSMVKCKVTALSKINSF